MAKKSKEYNNYDLFKKKIELHPEDEALDNKPSLF